jgi:GntR family transcriptional repressor for pyruvate dehydrogenase complex
MAKRFDTAKKDEKVTDYIISQVRDAIMSGRLKPGNRLASEKELTEEFQVSKATLREALRSLETMGLIEIRQGATGGIFLTEVNSQTLMHSMMNFMHFQSVSIREITMLRYMLEPHIARLAALKITDNELEQLKSYVDDGDLDNEASRKKNARFHHDLSRVTGNSLLILIVDFIDHLLDEMKQSLDLGTDFHIEVQSSHKKILNCLLSKDAEGAGRAMADDVVMVGTFMSEKMGEEAFDPSRFDPKIDTILKTISGGGSAKILQDLGSADMYLVVPRDKNGEAST